MTFYRTIIISFVMAGIMIQHASCFPSGEGFMHSLTHAFSGDHHSSSGHENKVNTVAVVHVNNSDIHENHHDDISDHVHVVERSSDHHIDGYGEHEDRHVYAQDGHRYEYGDGYNNSHSISDVRTRHVYNTPVHYETHHC
ncbi:Hypothetical protein CINCED_3A011357 [Cinara cedri]|uniref:Uncharacterized protein n=1 Tax=Cinara cedri TaxID=506608 RepID=A0A5E4NB56_9HEMI|nr:Hypothetical protein CINCED_3A011357 [Cinara cedri]